MVKGRTVKTTHWIEGSARGVPLVARIEVDAVVPDADPSEPVLDPAALARLDDAQRLADAGDIEGLAKLGQVYLRRSA